MISEKPKSKPWIMSLKKTIRPTEFHVYIGAVKIAEIAFQHGKYKCYVRFFGFEVKDYSSMSDALKDLHKLLQSPPTEGEVADAD